MINDERDFHPQIDSEEVQLGQGVCIEPGVSITGINGRAKRIIIGDHVYIGANTKVRVPELRIGDYTRINNHTLIYGYEPTHIGHNGWFGQNVVLNSTDRLLIGDNCCVSAYSQLWTHFQFGDVMEGCRFNSTKPLTLGKDVWISTHCVLSPIVVEDRAMALPGSIITADMLSNRVYAGNPARDVTDRLGPQFAEVSLSAKIDFFMGRLAAFRSSHPEHAPDTIGACTDDEVLSVGQSMFNISRRTYTKHGTAAEVAFMHHLLPRAKFTPT